MWSRDYGDIVTGAVLLLGGTAACVYCISTYDLGTLSAMGPGMFPAGAAGVLGFFGLLILVPALLRSGNAIHIEWRPLLGVLLSIGVFAATIETLGLVPATTALVVISVLADTRLRLRNMLILATGLAALAYLLFIKVLALPLAAVHWGA
jgi:hypothetical protein